MQKNNAHEHELISLKYKDTLYQEKLEIKNKILPSIRNKIRIARELGDLSENAEYQSELTKKDRFEQRLQLLEHILNTAIVFQVDKDKNKDKVCIGAYIQLIDQNNKNTLEFQLVSSFEVDPVNNKISYKSEIAKLILGKNTNHIFEHRNKKFKIQSIHYD